MAERTGESVRRIRSRVEKEGGADSLATQILERKVIDRILEDVRDRRRRRSRSSPRDEVETLDITATAPADEVADRGGRRLEVGKR